MSTFNVIAFPAPASNPRDVALPEPFVELPARLRGAGDTPLPAIAVIRRGPQLQVRCSRVVAGLLGHGGAFLDPASMPPVDVSLYLPAFPARPSATVRCTVSGVTVPAPGTFVLTLAPLESADDDEALEEFCTAKFRSA